MAKSRTILGQITEELAGIGRKIVTETAKVPVDIAAAAFEKSGGGKNQKTTNSNSDNASKIPPNTMLDAIDTLQNPKDRQSFARNVLSWLAGGRKEPEPSVYEEKMEQEARKKEAVKKQTAAAAYQQLPKTGSRPKLGSLFAAKKQAGSKTSRNVRQH